MKKEYLALCRQYDMMLMGSVAVLSFLGILLAGMVSSTFFFGIFMVLMGSSVITLGTEVVQDDFFISEWILDKMEGSNEE